MVLWKVLKVLADQARRISLAELSAALDVPKTSLFAILKELAQVGYVVFESDTYGLGPRARKLAESIHAGRSFLSWPGQFPKAWRAPSPRETRMRVAAPACAFVILISEYIRNSFPRIFCAVNSTQIHCQPKVEMSPFLQSRDVPFLGFTG